MSLECLIHETHAEPDACVIWMHGLGADGYDFLNIAEELDLPSEYRIRFLFPHAPIQPVTINGGMRMRAWYDIMEGNLGRQVDVEGILQSAHLIEELMHQQIQLGIPVQRILLAGFSQGGVIALHLGCRTSGLAGILALSTYAPTMESLTEAQKKSCVELPVFLGHGQFDPIVPISMAQKSLEDLTSLGCNVVRKTYPMPHSVCAEELRDIRDFFVKNLELL